VREGSSYSRSGERKKVQFAPSSASMQGPFGTDKRENVRNRIPNEALGPAWLPPIAAVEYLEAVRPLARDHNLGRESAACSHLVGTEVFQSSGLSKTQRRERLSSDRAGTLPVVHPFVVKVVVRVPRARSGGRRIQN